MKQLLIRRKDSFIEKEWKLVDQSIVMNKTYNSLDSTIQLQKKKNG